MTRRVRIRPLTAADQAEFLACALRSKALHSPWLVPPSTAEKFAAYLARMSQPDHAALAVCLADSGDIVGIFNLSQIVHGALRSAYLGYYAFAGFERQGLMKAGLRAVLRHAFKTLKLHRLEANIQPSNAASIALVKACGFAQEGYSPRYLKIKGRWRDHERWAVLADAGLVVPPNPQGAA